LDKANCEAVQKNLTDFMRIALIHYEDITKLLERHEKYVRAMHAKMEVVVEPIVPAVLETEAPKEEANMEKDDSPEPSILHVLNED
jgi:hypothetical protein